MKQLIHISITICIMAAFSLVSADVLVDHFEDYFAKNPEQCHLGEAYGNTIDKDSVHLGAGWWTTFSDSLGSEVTNSAGEPIDEEGTNFPTVIESGAMHVFLKTHTSTADFVDTWPYAGVWCGLMAGDSTYWDFTDLVNINLKLKGAGKIRVLLETKDIYEMVDTTGEPVGWGYYGFDINMDSTFKDWKDQVIPALLLDPEAYSPAADCLWTWDHGKTEVRSFVIQAIPDDDSTTNDSVELYVDNIYLEGLDYKNTFGFDFDTTVPIIWTPQKSEKINITITPNEYMRALNISYDLKKSSDVYIAVYNLKGKVISELVNERQESGKKRLLADFNTHAVTSGVYFITFRIDEATVTKRFSFIK